MKLIDWLKQEKMTWAAAARACGIDGVNPSRTLQRIGEGERSPDSDMVEKIMALSGGAVSAQDMHDVRLTWLRANQPERFETAETEAPLGGVPACSRPAAPDHAIESRVPGSSADEALAKEA